MNIGSFVLLHTMKTTSSIPYYVKLLKVTSRIKSPVGSGESHSCDSKAHPVMTSCCWFKMRVRTQSRILAGVSRLVGDAGTRFCMADITAYDSCGCINRGRPSAVNLRGFHKSLCASVAGR